MTTTQGNRGWAVMVAAIVMMLVAAIAAPAQKAMPVITLHSFDNTDGAAPWSAPAQAADGNLYGTTASGADDACNDGCGTVFKMTPSGTLTTLHSFDGTDGSVPLGGMIQVDGTFYGTTYTGGNSNSCSQGCGTVFKITPSGSLTTVYNFCSQSGCTDGQYPPPLIQGTDGNFYGMTSYGGTSGQGTVYKITPNGMLTTLHSFCSQSNCSDGSDPVGGLVEGTDGNFYGITQQGGINGSCEPYAGCGTIFKMTPEGALTTIHSFDGRDGSLPNDTLIQAIDGNFYGTSQSNGAYGNGTIFEITPGGKFTTLYNFGAQSGDGSGPLKGLIQATDGNFYGVTPRGGVNGDGTVFRITSSGAFTTLYAFCSQSDCTDGRSPVAALVQNTDGTLYGTTTTGGVNACSPGPGCGTVFGLSVGLGPFVKTVPTRGKVGRSVTILGTNLAGATSVTFNGTPATFTVESATFIKTTVPAGAITGPVQVVTPSGTLTSNVNFQVLP